MLRYLVIVAAACGFLGTAAVAQVDDEPTGDPSPPGGSSERLAEEADAGEPEFSVAGLQAQAEGLRAQLVTVADLRAMLVDLAGDSAAELEACDDCTAETRRDMALRLEQLIGTIDELATQEAAINAALAEFERLIQLLSAEAP